MVELGRAQKTIFIARYLTAASTSFTADRKHIVYPAGG
jgi:hypothetical protein